MAESLINSYANKCGITIETGRAIWKDAVKEADSAGKGDDIAYKTSVFKKLIRKKLGDDIKKKQSSSFFRYSHQSAPWLNEVYVDGLHRQLSFFLTLNILI